MQTISKYVVLGTLGKGAMGTVYLAKDTTAGSKLVAIKEIRPEFLMNAKLMARFKQEIQTLSKLHHPAIVHMMEAFEEAGSQYLVMEYVEGNTLEKMVDAQGPLSEIQAIQILCELLNALAYAHSQGIIHRDIKPGNVIITPSGKPKLLDFGIAKDLNASGLTTGRVIMGTGGYVSPEQAEGLHLDHRTDIYSLGCVLFFMLTGTHPYTRPKEADSLHLDIPASAQVESVVTKATQRDMTRRYDSCTAMAAALTACPQPAPVGPSTLQTLRLTVGRDPQCDVVMSNPSPRISRVHGTLEIIPSQDNQGVHFTYIFHDSSTNGTLINGTRHKNDAQVISFNTPVILAGLEPLPWERILEIQTDRLGQKAFGSQKGWLSQLQALWLNVVSSIASKMKQIKWLANKF